VVVAAVARLEAYPEVVDSIRVFGQYSSAVMLASSLIMRAD
jgi:hypothetical protein